ETQPGHWKSGCPVCQSRSGRPVSVRETDDRRVLIHAFCGCSTEAVLAAVGLQLADLFDVPIGQHAAPHRSRVPALDVLELVSFEIDSAAIILADVVEGRSISELAWQRVAKAAARSGIAQAHVHGR